MRISDWSSDVCSSDRIDHQHRHGTRAILFLGSTGEPTLLSPEEKKQVIVETVKLRPPGMAFFYGCTGASTDQVIDNVRFAHANGADGAVIAAPPYICAPEADIEQFRSEERRVGTECVSTCRSRW